MHPLKRRGCRKTHPRDPPKTHPATPVGMHATDEGEMPVGADGAPAPPAAGAHKRARAADSNECTTVAVSEAACEPVEWTPAWDPGTSDSVLPPAKRKRMLLMSQLYNTLRDGVLSAVEARRRRNAEEYARSLEIALRHPLPASCEACDASPPLAVSPGERTTRISPMPSQRSVLLGKHTPCMSPSKAQERVVPGLQLNAGREVLAGIMGSTAPAKGAPFAPQSERPPQAA